MHMSQLKPSKTPSALRAIDMCMIPVMFLLSGCKKDAIQETHPWHCYRGFKPEQIDANKTVTVSGEESLTRHFLFLFHAPILGGWKKYCVLAPASNTQAFYVGWIVQNDQGELVDHGINKLPIFDSEVRLLKGPINHSTQFFAVDADGNQVSLQKVDDGELGDGRHSGSRLL